MREPKPAVALLARGLLTAALLLAAFGVRAGAVLTTLYSFIGGDDGGFPLAPLVEITGGDLYGTTVGGGVNGQGAIFKITRDGVLTPLYSFGSVTDTNGNLLDGAFPQAGLALGADGSLYGTTLYGGTNDSGVVFKISMDGALTTLHFFNGGGDGSGPNGLVQGIDRDFYGTTLSGGANGNDSGTVFKISTNGAFATLYSFTGGGDGGAPLAALVQGSDGNFYGTTASGAGTVFQINTSGTLTTLYTFTGRDLHGLPSAALVEGADGYFYGTTAMGGLAKMGSVFRISTNGALAPLYSFKGSGDGATPNGLVRGSDGFFYGTALHGGAYDGTTAGMYEQGTLFKIGANGVLSSLYDFTGGDAGGSPSTALIQGSDGRFYGTTLYGGAASQGTVFRLAIEPEFQSAILANGTMNLTWSTEAGGTYQLQANSELGSTNWANVGGPLTAAGSTLSVTNVVASGVTLFYRVAILP